MGGKVRVVYKAAADGPVAVAAFANATAVGEDTYAASALSVEMSSHGRVTITSGAITATASASSPEGEIAYATASTAVVSNSDILRSSTTTASGSGDTNSSSWSTETSTTRFFAVDIDGVDLGNGPLTLEMTKEEVIVSQPELEDGNLAILDVEVAAYGADTYTAVVADVLVVQDQLSSAFAVALASSDGF